MAQSTINSSYDNNPRSTSGPVDWATKRAANGDDVDATYSLRLQVSGNAFFTMSRALFIFPTSTLPDNATITSATFGVYITGKVDFVGNNGAFQLVKGTTASDSAIVAADYQGTVNDTTKHADATQTIAGVTLNQYTDFTLNATGLANISLTGVSKFGLKWTNDADNSTPGTTDQDPLVAIQHTADANPPRLVITYTLPGGGAFLFNFA